MFVLGKKGVKAATEAAEFVELLLPLEVLKLGALQIRETKRSKLIALGVAKTDVFPDKENRMK
jgi:hypothetical protein